MVKKKLGWILGLLIFILCINPIKGYTYEVRNDFAYGSRIYLSTTPNSANSIRWEAYIPGIWYHAYLDIIYVVEGRTFQTSVSDRTGGYVELPTPITGLNPGTEYNSKDFNTYIRKISFWGQNYKEDPLRLEGVADYDKNTGGIRFTTEIVNIGNCQVINKTHNKITIRVISTNGSVAKYGFQIRSNAELPFENKVTLNSPGVGKALEFTYEDLIPDTEYEIRIRTTGTDKEYYYTLKERTNKEPAEQAAENALLAKQSADSAKTSAEQAKLEASQAKTNALNAYNILNNTSKGLYKTYDVVNSAKDEAINAKNIATEVKNIAQQTNDKTLIIEQKIDSLSNKVSVSKPEILSLSWANNKTITKSSSEKLYLNCQDANYENGELFVRYSINNGSPILTALTDNYINVGLTSGLNKVTVIVENALGQKDIKEANIWKL